MKRKLITSIGVIVILFTLVFYTPVGAMAFSYFSKQIHGLAQDRYTNEVTIIDTHASGNSKYVVFVQSNAQTVPLKVYTVYLYFDDVVQPQTQTVSWLLAEIPGVTKKITFTGSGYFSSPDYRAGGKVMKQWEYCTFKTSGRKGE